MAEQVFRRHLEDTGVRVRKMVFAVHRRELSFPVEEEEEAAREQLP